jgi:hypothetical protein
MYTALASFVPHRHTTHSNSTVTVRSKIVSREQMAALKIFIVNYRLQMMLYEHTLRKFRS